MESKELSLNCRSAMVYYSGVIGTAATTNTFPAMITSSYDCCYNY